MILNAVIEKDGDGYFAYIPNLKGCVSQGDSFEQALHNINEASELYLASLTADEIAQITSKETIVPR